MSWFNFVAMNREKGSQMKADSCAPSFPPPLSAMIRDRKTSRQAEGAVVLERSLRVKRTHPGQSHLSVHG